ncbi:hypothetical protein [Nostoc sp. PCC 9305]|uniref:hypothetical protein n=1 Tax=Nostoc sp. PCC 9305 TaxID=296636 RepID=UPI0039C74686
MSVEGNYAANITNMNKIYEITLSLHSENNEKFDTAKSFDFNFWVDIFRLGNNRGELGEQGSRGSYLQ